MPSAEMFVHAAGPQDPSMLAGTDGRLAVYYSPFDFVERSAKVAIVGITPGLQQAEIALSTFKREMAAHHNPNQAFAAVKRQASFAGMRGRLVRMLDHVGLQRALRLESTQDLFHPEKHLLHTTSLVRNPVFVSGKNYSGSPHPMRNEMLRRMVDAWFVSDAAMLPNDIVWVPLGRVVGEALVELQAAGKLHGAVLDGIPHPSGANAERIAYFLGQKDADRLSVKTNATAIDTARERLIGKVGRLGGGAS